MGKTKVDNILADMHNQESTDKGSFGEKAVLKICESLYQMQGGILYHSFTYSVDKDLPGNIKKDDDGSFYLENLSNSTEIDVLFVTPFRIFPIEVKAYRANKITLTDDSIKGCYVTNKSPVHQNEMHCRHLYSGIFMTIPEGNPDYIVPIVCMVDKAEIIDSRSDWQKDYIHLCTLNTLKHTLIQYNKPLDYKLNLVDIDNRLKEIKFSHEKYFPVRV